MSTEQQQIGNLLGFISRHVRLLLSCLLCGMAAGLAWYLMSPKVFQATALIMYQQQQVNPTRMSPDVQTRLLEMVNTVSQQVTSRTNLEEIIKAHDLYPELREKLPMEDVVGHMRGKDIRIDPRKGADIFEVSFSGDDPRQVMRVTNSLASKFIEENIRFREQRVTETSAYIKDELAIAKASLDKQEEGMRDYKLRFYNEMPDQRVANIARLSALQAQDQGIQNNLQDLKRTQVLIQEQISLRKEALARISAGEAGAAPAESPPTELARISLELEKLRSRYTDNHPDVKRLQSRLAALSEGQAETGGAPGQEAPRPASARRGEFVDDKQLVQLEFQLKEIDISVARLSREQETVRRQVAQVQQWVENTPIREAEWAALTRDYTQLQQHYQSLVARNLEAESAELLERRQKGSQFRVIEPAHQPSKPFSPNFRKIMFLAIALGLGAGLGLSYAQELLDTSFKDVNDLEIFLGLPVTCAIPVLPTVRESKRQRLRNAAWVIALSVGYGALGSGLVLLWHRGAIIL